MKNLDFEKLDFKRFKCKKFIYLILRNSSLRNFISLSILCRRSKGLLPSCYSCHNTNNSTWLERKYNFAFWSLNNWKLKWVAMIKAVWKSVHFFGHVPFWSAVSCGKCRCRVASRMIWMDRKSVRTRRELESVSRCISALPPVIYGSLVVSQRRPRPPQPGELTASTPTSR